jgi:hypothetical protein
VTPADRSSRLSAALLGAALGGGLLFLAAVTAAFATVPAGALLPFLSALFPRFYALTGGAALLAAALAASRRRTASAVAAGFAALLQAVGLFALLPAVHRAIGTGAFPALHGLSLGVALLALLATALALFL